MSRELPLWNLEDALGRFSGSQEILFNILTLFIVDANRIINELEDAIEQKDFVKIKVYAHTLKGSSSNVSAMKIQNISQLTEHSAMKKDIDSIQLLYKELKLLWEDTVEAFETYLESNKKHSIINITDEEMKQCLISLKHNLENSSFIDTQKLKILHTNISAEIKSELNELQSELDCFEFEKALVIVNNLLYKLYYRGEDE